MVIEWGIMLVGYLYVGGMAGGAFMISAVADLLGKGKYRVLSKSGSYLSLVAILVGLVLLVLDLGRFRIDPLTALNSYINFPTSIVTVGTWIITAFMATSLLTSVLWLFNGSETIRKLLELAGLVLGGSTAAYTGLLLSFSGGRPFWGTPFLPWLFVISGTITGFAMLIVLIPLIAKLMPRAFGDFRDLFANEKEFAGMIHLGQKYIDILTVVELGLIVILVVAGNAYNSFQTAGLSLVFLAYMIIGLILPLGIGFYTRSPKIAGDGNSMMLLSFSGFAMILIGGFLLRYIMLFTGQILG
jgi:formate-dependent nitrite reductase membrane component NrfD